MSESELLIRTLQPDDVAVCARIYRLAYEALAMGTPWDEPTAARIIMEVRRRFPEECFVAERQGTVVGFILCSSLAGLRATIEELAVAPEHQERGIGGRLMEHAMDYYRRRGVAFIELVANRRSPAWRFYRRRGFHESVDYRLMTREL